MGFMISAMLLRVTHDKSHVHAKFWYAGKDLEIISRFLPCYLHVAVMYHLHLAVMYDMAPASFLRVA